MLGELLAILTATLWASTSVLSRKALEDMSPTEVNLVRAISSSAALWLILFKLKGWEALTWIDAFSLTLLTAAVLIGVGLGDFMLFKSMKLIGVSKSVALSSTYPLFTTLISIVALEEKLTSLNALGITLIVFGIFLISLSKNSEINRPRSSDTFTKGVALSIGTALTWSIGITLIALSIKEADPITANAYRLPILAIILAATMSPTRGLRKTFKNSKSFLWAFLAGVTGLGLGTTAYFGSIKLIGMAKATALSSIYPIITAIAATLVLREKPGLKTWTAIGLTVLGLLLTIR